MTFIRKVWEAFPSTATPVTAAELNRMEAGIESASTPLFWGEDVTAISTGGTAAVVPGTMGSFVTNGRAVLIGFGGYVGNTAANGVSAVQLVVDGVNVSNGLLAHVSATANARSSVYREVLLDLAAGTHNCHLTIISYSAGNAQFVGTGGVPTILKVMKT